MKLKYDCIAMTRSVTLDSQLHDMLLASPEISDADGLSRWCVAHL